MTLEKACGPCLDPQSLPNNGLLGSSLKGSGTILLHTLGVQAYPVGERVSGPVYWDPILFWIIRRSPIHIKGCSHPGRGLGKIPWIWVLGSSGLGSR